MNLLPSPIRLVAAFLVATLMAMLTACAGMQKPVSAEDYVQSAKSQVAGAYRTIGDLKAQGAINADEGALYFKRVENVEKGVREAESIQKGGGDVSTVKGKLDVTLALLATLRAELAKRAPPKP